MHWKLAYVSEHNMVRHYLQKLQQQRCAAEAVDLDSFRFATGPTTHYVIRPGGLNPQSQPSQSQSRSPGNLPPMQLQRQEPRGIRSSRSRRTGADNTSQGPPPSSGEPKRNGCILP
ncbi:hypothetical protein VaNZ11_013038 [Volvox africanus]|uniref:Uncharacterized protein n=1 Tax=Volvox africanus TaxID=51714 RepID=A0ABQ5SGX0_9CHLO|nr:hypothetical protein VaNZ11_013038 [Volvox africanus]